MRQKGRGHIWTPQRRQRHCCQEHLRVREFIFYYTNAQDSALFCTLPNSKVLVQFCPDPMTLPSLERALKDATQWKVISWSLEGVRNGHIPFSLIFSIPSRTYLGRFTTHLTRGSVPITRVPSSFCAWLGMGPLLLSL